MGEVQGGLGVPNLGDGRARSKASNARWKSPAAPSAATPETCSGKSTWRARILVLATWWACAHGPPAAIAHYREALRLFEPIAPRVAHDMNAQFELASLYEGLGDFLGNPGLENVGDFEGARQAYEKSLAISQAISAEHPDNLRSHRAEGMKEMKIADVEVGMGNMEEALRRYRGAVASLEAVSARYPLDPSTRLFLALAVGNLGQALEDTGQTRAALEEYTRRPIWSGLSCRPIRETR